MASSPSKAGGAESAKTASVVLNPNELALTHQDVAYLEELKASGYDPSQDANPPLKPTQEASSLPESRQTFLRELASRFSVSIYRNLSLSTMTDTIVVLCKGFRTSAREHCVLQVMV
jgi:hypothetical protein